MASHPLLFSVIRAVIIVTDVYPLPPCKEHCCQCKGSRKEYRHLRQAHARGDNSIDGVCYIKSGIALQLKSTAAALGRDPLGRIIRLGGQVPADSHVIVPARLGHGDLTGGQLNLDNIAVSHFENAAALYLRLLDPVESPFIFRLGVKSVADSELEFKQLYPVAEAALNGFCDSKFGQCVLLNWNIYYILVLSFVSSLTFYKLCAFSTFNGQFS